MKDWVNSGTLETGLTEIIKQRHPFLFWLLDRFPL